MKKLFAYAGLMIVLHLPVSCGCDSAACECGSFGTSYSTIGELSALAGRWEDTFYNVNQGDTLDAASVAIQIRVVETQTAYVSSRHTAGLLSQAWACSPPAPVPTQQIERISITSNLDMRVGDKIYASGENLIGLLYIADRHCDWSGRCQIDQFIALQQEDTYFFGIQGSELIFTWLQAPEACGDQQFTVRLEFSDATVMEVSTQSITSC